MTVSSAQSLFRLCVYLVLILINIKYSYLYQSIFVNFIIEHTPKNWPQILAAAHALFLEMTKDS